MVYKNSVSTCESSPTHYGGFHKIFWENFFGCSVRQIYGLIHMKNQKIWENLRKELVYAEIAIKNGVSIREGSPTHYGGPHKYFWEKIMGAPCARSMG